MSDLTEFLLARIAEDEEDARTRSIGRGWRIQWLADCEANRRIVERLSPLVDYDRDCAEGVATFTLRALALPYADHPDYREEWKP